MTENDKQIEQEITRLEQKWFNAVCEHDRDALNRIIAADCLFAGGSPDGSMADKKIYIEDGTMSVIEDMSYSYDRVKFRAYENTAVVNTVFKFRVVVGGAEEMSGAHLLTDVWVKRDGGWQVVMRHSSVLSI
ncbi:MAG TPA: nuclear transport factor 2 family protein [Pyrinomonadaceae bacterium]|jgi:uncharacterized protein (TIGR02246 family)